MDGAMAPPFKRRKLSNSLAEPDFRLDNSTAPADTVPSHSHHVTSLQHTYSSLAPARTDFPQDDGQRIPQPVVGGIADFKVLVPRQGTGSSSSAAATNGLATNALEALTAAVTSEAAAITSSISVSLSTSISSPTLSADTIPAGVTPSESSTSASSQPTSPSSNTSDTSNTSNTSNTASSTISSSSSNETSTITSSATRSTSTIASSESSLSQNLTTSGESSGTTSRTTIGSDNQTSSTASTDTALLFFFTLSNGDITTISQQTGAYTTTLRDGEVLTVPSISATTTGQTSTASRTSSISSTSSEETNTITSTADVSGVGGQGATTATATYSSTTSTTSAASGGGGGGSNDTPAGTIAGGVVGGAAGLAVLVLIAMLFVRWYRRKGQLGHRELPPGSATSPDTSEQPPDRGGPGMAERAGLMPFAAALPALFRHQNRSVEGSAPSERGFTRVSGRKLPSAFSGGMSSDEAGSHQQRQQSPPGMPLTGSPPDERNLSSTSFYRDSQGFYGGDGTAGRSSTSPTSATSPTSPTSPSSNAPIHPGPEMMTMSPGPQRQPQVHSGGPYTMSPGLDMASSPSGAAAQFARSDTPSSLRNSRFTEDM